MHSKENISTILKNPNILERIIESLPVSIENTRDMTNLSVWGVLNEQDKENLLRLLDYYEDKKNNLEENIDSNLLREFKKTGIKIIRFIDSIGTHRKVSIEYKLDHMMSISGIALEYFLIDSISRLYKENIIKIEKGPDELEGKKVDFILNQDGIKLGIQLTLTKLKNQAKKRGEVSNARNNMNNKKWYENEKKVLSSKYINDTPVFMIINSEISEQTQNNNILWYAYKEWKKDGFPSGGPSVYLSKENQKELNEICSSLHNTIKIAFDYLRKQYEKGDQEEYAEQQIENMHLIYNGDELEISYYKNEKDGRIESNFIYSIEIFITDKLIEKLFANNNL